MEVRQEDTGSSETLTPMPVGCQPTQCSGRRRERHGLRARLGREMGKTLAVSEGHLKMLSPAVGKQEKEAVLLCAEE